MSLRSQIEIDDIHNEIAMDNSCSTVYLIVEGETDEKLFEDLTNEEHCTVKSVGNKDAVISMMTRLMYEGKAKWVVGVVDNDQKRLSSEKLPYHTIYTDTNDIETMILWSDAFYKVARHLFKPSKIPNKQTIENLRDLMIQRALPISELRVVDKRNHWGFSFKDLNYGKFIKKSNLEYEGDLILIRKLKAVSQLEYIDEAEIIEGLKKLRNEQHDTRTILVGHDLTNVVAHSLSNYLGKSTTKDFDNEQVELFFRSAYTVEDFQKTKLRADIAKLMAWTKLGFLL